MSDHMISMQAIRAERKVAAETNTALRKQVADLRAALEALDGVLHFDLPWQREGSPVRVNAMNAAMKQAVRVLAATQPQEVQS